MLADLQGGRCDNRPWPGYKGLIDVPEWEAEQLYKGGNAEPADAPDIDRGYDVLRVPDPDFEEHLRESGTAEVPEAFEDEEVPERSHVPPDFDSDFDRDEDENEVTVTAPVKKPYANANRAAWEEYAVSKGADPATLDDMTRKQIISEYGN